MVLQVESLSFQNNPFWLDLNNGLVGFSEGIDVATRPVAVEWTIRCLPLRAKSSLFRMRETLKSPLLRTHSHSLWYNLLGFKREYQISDERHFSVRLSIWGEMIPTICDLQSEPPSKWRRTAVHGHNRKGIYPTTSLFGVSGTGAPNIYRMI